MVPVNDATTTETMSEIVQIVAYVLRDMFLSRSSMLDCPLFVSVLVVDVNRDAMFFCAGDSARFQM